MAVHDGSTRVLPSQFVMPHIIVGVAFFKGVYIFILVTDTLSLMKMQRLKYLKINSIITKQTAHIFIIHLPPKQSNQTLHYYTCIKLICHRYTLKTAIDKTHHLCGTHNLN